MGKVRHVVTGVVVQSQHQFQCAISQNKVAGFNGHWREQQTQTCIGEQHAKAKQQSKNGTRSTDDRNEHVSRLRHAGAVSQIRIDLLYTGKPSPIGGIKPISHHDFMQEKRTQTTGQIVVEKALCPPNSLQLRPKHEQREHVKEQVTEPRMHEHVGDHLPRLKLWRTRIVTGQDTGQVREQHMRDQIENTVDNQQVTNNRRGLTEHVG